MFNYISKWGKVNENNAILYFIHQIAKLKSLGLVRVQRNECFYTLLGIRKQSIKLESSLVISSKVEDAHLLWPSDLDVYFKKTLGHKKTCRKMFIAAIVENGKQLSRGMNKLVYQSTVIKIIDLYQYVSILINVKNIM